MARTSESEPQRHKEKLDHNSIVITIDGSTTAGKRLVAERLAQRYNLSVLDTGTTIRALALLAIENGLVKTVEDNVSEIPPDFGTRLLTMYETLPIPLTIAAPRRDEQMSRVMVGSRDMRGELLGYRKQKAINNLSAVIAAHPMVRDRLYGLWHAAVRNMDGGAVVIGRKTGVDLFPTAPIKFYFFSSPEASAVYRVMHDPTATLRMSTEEQYVRERDAWEHGQGLLEQPADALVVDTSDAIKRGNAGIDDLVGRITSHIEERFEIV